MNRALSDMTVLVTGASRGIGAAIARRFATVGMNIVIHYLQAHEEANETARACIQLGGRVMTATGDLRDRAQVMRLKERMDVQGFQPDILVNNAAVSHYGMLSDLTDDIWDDVMALNLRGTFICSQLFMPHMISQRFGRIINISSVWGEKGASCEALYAATKGGINALTKSLAKELAPSGVTVNAVAPGVVDTAMMNGFDDAEKLALQQDIPAGRFAQPDEIASLVYFLALPESGYINGQVISPNGGWQT